LLLDMVADALSELHDFSLTSPKIRSAVDQLMIAASAVGPTAQSEAEAANEACALWFADVDRLIGLPDIADAEKELLAKLRVRRVNGSSNPFDALFAAVTQRAAAVYGECWPQTVLSVSSLPRHPRAAAQLDPYGIFGRTVAGRSVTVELMI